MSLGKDNGPQIPIAVGIIVGLLASLVQSLGLTIQRKSHVLNQALPDAQQRSERRRPLWLLGFAIFFFSNVLGSIFQIASLPVVILAPLGAVSLLWNAVFARLLLGDVFSPWMILGTLLIAGGAVLIAVFGIVAEPTHSLEDLLALFRRPAFVAYFSILGFIVFAALVVTHVVEYSYSRRPLALPVTPPMSPLVSIHGNTLSAQAQPDSERTPLLSPNGARSPSPTPSTAASSIITMKPSRTALFLAISYASFSGILSGMCLIFAKSGVELLLLTVSGHNQFWRWESWVLVLGLAVFALLQLWYLHKSLVLADPTLVCPLAFCFYNLSSIFNGLVYYDQFSLLPTKFLVLVLVGIVVLLAGVWVVSFPANGSAGGVDVGTWQEGDELVEHCLDGTGTIRLDVDAPDTHPDDLERGRARESTHIIGLAPINGVEWGPKGEPPSPLSHVDATGLPNAAHAEASAPDAHPTSPPPQTVHDRLHTDTDLLVSPTRSGRRRLTTISTARSSKGSAGGPASPQARAAQRDSHLLSPPIGAGPLGGFSIGLSPVSPGFALVPHGRGRKVSGPGFRDVVRRMAMRRTASEGDVGTGAGAGVARAADGEGEAEGYLSAGGNGNGRAHAEEARRTHEAGADGAGDTEPRKEHGATARWRWLKGIFVR